MTDKWPLVQVGVEFTVDGRGCKIVGAVNSSGEVFLAWWNQDHSESTRVPAGLVQSHLELTTALKLHAEMQEDIGDARSERDAARQQVADLADSLNKVSRLAHETETRLMAERDASYEAHSATIKTLDAERAWREQERAQRDAALAEVERLKAEHSAAMDHAIDMYTGTCEELRAARATIATLLEALEFYAAADNYEMQPCERRDAALRLAESKWVAIPAMNDAGKRAREAIARVKGGEGG